MASSFDTKTYCRQTLVGGNYGLLDTNTFVPNPDYYRLFSFFKSNSTPAPTHIHKKKKKKGVWKDAYSMPINSIAVYFAVPSFGTVWWAITFCRQTSLEQTKYVLMLTVQRKRWVWSIFRFIKRKMKDDKQKNWRTLLTPQVFIFAARNHIALDQPRWLRDSSSASFCWKCYRPWYFTFTWSKNKIC